MNELQDARMLLLGDVPVADFVEHLYTLEQNSSNVIAKVKDGDKKGALSELFDKQTTITEGHVEPISQGSH